MICLVLAAGIAIFVALPLSIWIGSSRTLEDPDNRKDFLEHL